ncbi:MAG TPA: rhomboid family intramembrane serine protease [Chitinophagales bacterium]|nr:rhomboid family intramembrane serine protease [Chitinophagales bacterium]
MQIDLIIIIIAITVGVSFLAFQNRELMYKLMMRPFDVVHSNQYYRLVTSGFIHIDWMHLFVNMIVLFSFGRGLLNYYNITFAEKSLYYFICLYLGGIIFSDLPSLIKHKNNPGFNSLGASGAVSAVLFAYIFFNPLGGIGFIFLPGLEIPSVIWGVLYMVYSIYMGKRGGDNVNHDAHLFGAIFGVLFTFAMKPELAVRFIKNLTSYFN